MRRPLLLLPLLVALAPAAAADPPGNAAGRQLFADYCARCHGADGRGDGPDADTLASTPPDLTTLSQRYGSPLSRRRIAAFIDGREEVKSHGPRDMPVWGKIFYEGDAGPPQGIDSARRSTVDALVDYLVSIQAFQHTRRAAPSAGG